MIGALGGGLKAGITLYAIDRMSATVNSATTKAEASMKQMQMRNEAMNKSMLQTSQYLSMMKVGLAGMAVSGVAIGASVKQFADFQKSIAYISTLIDDVKFDYKSMSNDILKIAGETGKDIEDVARGVYQAISTSIEPEKATQFIEVVSKAAVAGGANIETSANAILTVLKSYGMETEKAMEVSDKLFQTVKLGRVEFLQLSDAVAGFAQTGALAGVSIDELLGAFAALTMVGVPVDEASTSLNRFLLSVVDSNKEAQDFAKSLGLEFNVSHLKKVGILAFLDEINSKIGTDVEKIQKLFPEMRAFRAVAPLMNTARESFKKFSGEIETSSGTTEKAMEKMENTISHRVDTIKQKMKGIGIKVGETFALSLEGPITKIDDFLGKTLESEKSINRMQTGLKVILGAGSILGGLGAIGWLSKTIGGIGAGLKAGFTGKALAGGGAIATGAKTVGAVAASPAAVGTLLATGGLYGSKKIYDEFLTGAPVRTLKDTLERQKEVEKEIEKTIKEMNENRTSMYHKEMRDYLYFLNEQKREIEGIIAIELADYYKSINKETYAFARDFHKWVDETKDAKGTIGGLARIFDWLDRTINKNDRALRDLVKTMELSSEEIKKRRLEEAYEIHQKETEELYKKYYTLPWEVAEATKYPFQKEFVEKLTGTGLNLTINIETPEGKTSYKIKKSIEDLQRENTIRLKSIGVPYPE